MKIRLCFYRSMWGCWSDMPPVLPVSQLTLGKDGSYFFQRPNGALACLGVASGSAFLSSLCLFLFQDDLLFLLAFMLPARAQMPPLLGSFHFLLLSDLPGLALPLPGFSGLGICSTIIQLVNVPWPIDFSKDFPMLSDEHVFMDACLCGSVCVCVLQKLVSHYYLSVHWQLHFL